MKRSLITLSLWVFLPISTIAQSEMSFTEIADSKETITLNISRKDSVIDSELAIHYTWLNPNQVQNEFIESRNRSNVHLAQKLDRRSVKYVISKKQKREKDLSSTEVYRLGLNELLRKDSISTSEYNGLVEALEAKKLSDREAFNLINEVRMDPISGPLSVNSRNLLAVEVVLRNNTNASLKVTNNFSAHTQSGLYTSAYSVDDLKGLHEFLSPEQQLDYSSFIESFCMPENISVPAKSFIRKIIVFPAEILDQSDLKISNDENESTVTYSYRYDLKSQEYTLKLNHFPLFVRSRYSSTQPSFRDYVAYTSSFPSIHRELGLMIPEDNLNDSTDVLFVAVLFRKFYFVRVPSVVFINQVEEQKLKDLWAELERIELFD